MATSKKLTELPTSIKAVSINRDFSTLLDVYVRRYNNTEGWSFGRGNHDGIVRAINEVMKDRTRSSALRTHPFHPLTSEVFSRMLNGEAGPTAEILDAMVLVLKLYNADRELFMGAGTRAVNEQKMIFWNDYLASPEGQERIRKQEAEKAAALRIERELAQWRANTPESCKDQPSFQEMLEESHAKGENFGQFIYERVFPTWGMTQLSFCKHLETLNAANQSEGKRTFTDTVMSSWRRSYYPELGTDGKNKPTKPLRDSVDVICRAFGIKPHAGESMATHERMLWKAIDGHEFAWTGAEDKPLRGIEAIEQAIADTKNTGNSGPLVIELIRSSGIRFERLKTVLHTQQLAQWMKGAHIENTDTAIAFLKLVNPHPSEEMTGKTSAQNRQVLSILTGREFTIDTMLDICKHAGNPRGALFTALTGRSGIITLSPTEIVTHFNAAGIECTEDRLKKMRCGTQLERGGRIYEQDAAVIIGMVEGSITHLVELGIAAPLTSDQKEKMTDMLTGYPHPKEMLAMVVAGEMTAGEMVANTCERRNLNHMGENSFCEQVGLSHISSFVLGKSRLFKDTAQKIMAWYEQHYAFSKEEQAQFTEIACGLKVHTHPDDILAAVMEHKISRWDGLRAIYDASQITRRELTQATNAPPSAIIYSATERSGGRITADSKTIRAIGKACGISPNRLDAFEQTFSAEEVDRGSSLGFDANGHTEEWRERILGNRNTGALRASK